MAQGSRKKAKEGSEGAEALDGVSNTMNSALGLSDGSRRRYRKDFESERDFSGRQEKEEQSWLYRNHI